MELLKRFPQFELSYETISHKKVPEQYDICIAIPVGKKVFIWFTFHGKDDVCFLLDINKDKRIYQSTKINTSFDPSLSLGTVLYGSIIIDDLDNSRKFVAEDIFFYKGIRLNKSKMNEKLSFLLQFMNIIMVERNNKQNEISFYLPVMWDYNKGCSSSSSSSSSSNNHDDSSNYGCLPFEIKPIIGYPVHHVQYRSTYEIAPFLNFLLNTAINRKLSISTKNKSPSINKFEISHNKPDYSKSQYKYPTTFQVTAHVQFDIYHLFAFGKNKTPIYYNVAHISNYKTSVFMNSLFRNIRENKNLDYIEESDNEDEFHNNNIDKYVNLNKTLLIECIFSNKFKKWIPVKVVGKHSKVVHISQL
jgi:hypothetical protein